MRSGNDFKFTINGITYTQDMLASFAYTQNLPRAPNDFGVVSDRTAADRAAIEALLSSGGSGSTKTLVIMGSSNGAGLGASTYTGDPTEANGWASPPTSWAGILTAALKAIDPQWRVYNVCISGSGIHTAGTGALARFTSHVARFRPSHVILCNHPLNDALDPVAVFRGTGEFCRRCDSIGAIPILRGASMYNSYTAAQYQAMLSLNKQIDLLGRHRIDHFSTLDNGSGGFAGGKTYHNDGLHPNDAGYAVMADAIDLGLLLYGDARRAADEDRGSAWSVRSDSPNGNGLLINAASGLLSPLKSLTMRARIKPGASPGLARGFLVALNPKVVATRVRNAGGTYDLASRGTIGTSDVSSTEAVTHDVVMVINAATSRLQLYIDGIQKVSGPADSALSPYPVLSLGGRPESGSAAQAAGYSFADVGVWRVALGPGQIAEMNRSNRRPPASLIYGSSFTSTPGIGGLAPNVVRNGLLSLIGEATWQAAAAL